MAPGTRRPGRREEGGEPRVAGEDGGDLGGVGVEVEEAAQAGDQGHEHGGEGGVDVGADRGVVRVGAEADGSGVAAEVDDATIDIAVDMLDAGDRPGGEE